MSSQGTNSSGKTQRQIWEEGHDPAPKQEPTKSIPEKILNGILSIPGQFAIAANSIATNELTQKNLKAVPVIVGACVAPGFAVNAAPALAAKGFEIAVATTLMAKPIVDITSKSYAQLGATFSIAIDELTSIQGIPGKAVSFAIGLGKEFLNSQFQAKDGIGLKSTNEVEKIGAFAFKVQKLAVNYVKLLLE